VGVSIVPELTLRAEDRGRLASLRIPGVPRVAIGAIWRTAGYQSAAARGFLDILFRRSKDRQSE
jgi:DNA-binding transcriptional LysR family regulator